MVPWEFFFSSLNFLCFYSLCCMALEHCVDDLALIVVPHFSSAHSGPMMMVYLFVQI